MDWDGYLERASLRLDRLSSKYGTRSRYGCFRFFCWNVGQLLHFRRAMKPVSDDICRFVFILRGGMGDQILSLNYIQNLERSLTCRHEIAVGPARIHDLGMIQTLCRNQNFISKIYKPGDSVRNADIVIEILRFPRLFYANQKKIDRLDSKLSEIVNAVETFQTKNPFLFRYSTPADALGIDYCRLLGQNRLRQGDINNLLGVTALFHPQPEGDASALRAKYGLSGKRFITVQRGSGGRNGNISMKLWPTENYKESISKIRARFPDLAVIQVGKTSNDAIEGITDDLRGKTNLNEIMILLQESACHLDGEGGLVHLRHFLGGGPSVVLFGPTSSEFYGYPENINLQSPLCPHGCEWLTADYEKRCPRRFNGCQSSAGIDPESVFQSVTEILQ